MTRPPAACPKCGNQFGFLYSEPRFEKAAVRVEDMRPAREWLEWECRTCGYRVTTPTADAAKETP
jgi:rubrerythrin